MSSETETTRLTPKGARTRTRIVDAAVSLVQERGIAQTTLEDVKTSAGVSSSQVYHYFANKDALVQAVIDRQAELIVNAQQMAEMGTVEGLWAWRDGVVAHTRTVSGKGGCPLGHLVGQLAETDDDARAQLSHGFQRWAAALRQALETLAGDGGLAAGVDPARLGDTLLATLQGGLLLAQVQRDVQPLETALDTLLELAVGARRDR